MAFASRITCGPRVFDPDLGDLSLPHLADLPAELREFLANTASASPYLRTLIERESEWLKAALTRPLAEAFETLLQETKGADIRDLRRAKARMALLIGLADLGGAWRLDEVTNALTRFAERAVAEILNALLQNELEAGNLPASKQKMRTDSTGLFVIAMGKMGAHELNYSSDIDLILFFDQTRYAPSDVATARSVFLRVAKRMTAILSKITPDGYIFRTDLRLRPNPSVTPVVISVSAAEQYYESEGRNWERAAFIKARIVAGDLECGAAFLEHLSPFIWRKHLDFTAIEDAHAIRQSIRTSRDQSQLSKLEGYDVKLGPGGIREIEFFAQTRQLIFGGRNTDLRVRGTCAALSALEKAGQLEPEIRRDLQQSYVFLRMIEHRLQMLHDAQTHSLPQSAAGFLQLACLCDLEVAELQAKLRATFELVKAHIEGFFTPAPPQASTANPEMSEMMERWQTYPALRSNRAREIFPRIAPNILKCLAKSSTSDEALNNFDRFMKALPSGVQIFSLFSANPKLIELLVEICSIAPALADYLAHNNAVFDAVIAGDVFGKWPGLEALQVAFSNRLNACTDYENALDTTRQWQRDWHFRIGLNLLKGYTRTDEAARYYAELSHAVLSALWPIVRTNVELKTGPIREVEFAILGMGSLGRRLMSPHSDLDIILLYRAPPETISPSDLQQYTTRMTRALIAAISAPTAEGRLYEIDLRLRPSGSKGPIAASWQAYQDYQENEAWVWEHLALCSAGAVAGDAPLCRDFETYRQSLLARQHERDKILQEVGEMRARLAKSTPAFDDENPKKGPGGFSDIVLVSQTATLLNKSPETDIKAQIKAGIKAGFWNDEEARTLGEAFELYNTVLHISQLTQKSWRKSTSDIYLRACKQETQNHLAQHLGRAAKVSSNLIDRVFNTADKTAL